MPDVLPFSALYKISPLTTPVTSCLAVTLLNKTSTKRTIVSKATFFEIPITGGNQLIHLEAYILRRLLVTAATGNQRDSPKDQEKIETETEKSFGLGKNERASSAGYQAPINRKCELLLQSASIALPFSLTIDQPFKGFRIWECQSQEVRPNLPSQGAYIFRGLAWCGLGFLVAREGMPSGTGRTAWPWVLPLPVSAASGCSWGARPGCMAGH